MSEEKVEIPEDLVLWLSTRKWRYASSMRWCHHFYVVADWYEGAEKATFYKLVRFLREKGYWDSFGNLRNQYLRLGENFKIWTMGSPVEETTVLNIAHKDSSSDKNIFLNPNNGIFQERV